MAISSPLLETSINGARGVLVNITGSEDIGLEEVEQAAEMVRQAAHPEALIIFGAAFDPDMEDEMQVTVIATGYDEVPQKGSAKPEEVRVGGTDIFSRTAEKIAGEWQESISGQADAQAAEDEEDKKHWEDIMRIFNGDK